MAVAADAVYTRLSTFAGLTALVSTRTYPVKAVQEPTKPFVWFRMISEVRPSTMSVDTGLVGTVFETNAIADTAESSSNVAEQVRAALQRWRDSGASPAIVDSFMVNRRVFFEEGKEEIRTLAEFLVWSRE